MVKTMFADVPPMKKKNFCIEVAKDTDSEHKRSEDEHDEEVEDEDNSDRQAHRGKSDKKSAMYAKASNTKIIKQVLHAHAMLDGKETDGKDVSFHDLPFNLLVAGELEIILSKVSSEENLTMLKKLAYKAQFLDQQSIRDRYAGFLRKFEKGKCRWVSESALRDLDEALCFSTFNSLHKQTIRSVLPAKKGDPKPDMVPTKKFYCLDFNKGTCQFEGTHEGRFNKALVNKVHMCRTCWEKEGVEKPHLAGHSDCAYSAK